MKALFFGLAIYCGVCAVVRAETVAMTLVYEPSLVDVIYAGPSVAPVTWGWKFSVLGGLPITITEVGVFGLRGPLEQAYDVGIWSETGNILGRGRVGTDEPNEFAYWRFSKITPVTLRPNETFYVGQIFPASSTSAPDATLKSIPAYPDSAPEINFVGSLAAGVDELTGNLIEPVSQEEMLFFGATFKYEIVPEPSGMLLIGFGCCMLAVMRFRQRQMQPRHCSIDRFSKTRLL